jgi:hypothetical protein
MQPSEGVYIIDLTAYRYDRPALGAAGTLLVAIGADARARCYAECVTWAVVALAQTVQDVLNGLPPVRGIQFDLSTAPEDQVVDVCEIIQCAGESTDILDSPAGHDLADLLAAPFRAELSRRMESQVIS